jgi:hypothetical protein
VHTKIATDIDIHGELLKERSYNVPGYHVQLYNSHMHEIACKREVPGLTQCAETWVELATTTFPSRVVVVLLVVESPMVDASNEHSSRSPILWVYSLHTINTREAFEKVNLVSPPLPKALPLFSHLNPPDPCISFSPPFPLDLEGYAGAQAHELLSSILVQPVLDISKLIAFLGDGELSLGLFE